MLANLAEGLPLLVWDNIATGSVIRCPTLEKVLTSSRYADRSLGETRRRTVPAQTIMALTGNNLRPAGDLASRTLLCRLDVDRVDPENRSFRHVDPIAWTVQNPGELLRALYTIVLANPQLKTPVEPQTRFKEWWHLVGSAIEHAAAELRRLAPEAVPYPVIFKSLFAFSEGDDDDAVDLGDLLSFVSQWRGTEPFKASHLVDRNNVGCSAGEESSLTARGYFESKSSRGDRNLTSMSAGRALMAIEGTPVTIDGVTMRLVRTSARENKRTAEFRLVTLNCDFGDIGDFSRHDAMAGSRNSPLVQNRNTVPGRAG